MTTPASAAGAYANLAGLLGNTPGGGKAGSDGSEGADFGSLVKEAMNAVADTGHKADVQTQAAVSGKANIIDVVTAVAESEVAVGALVSVRDRVIQSYDEIMKMPI